MRVRRLGVGEAIAVGRGAPVVVVIGGAGIPGDDARRRVEHVAAGIGGEVPLLLGAEASAAIAVSGGDASSSVREAIEVGGREDPRAAGDDDAAILAACDCAPDADVAIVALDVLVCDGWLDGLRRAAHSDSTLASATALVIDDAVLGVPGLEIDDPGGTLGALGAARAAWGPPRYPRVAHAGRECVYLRREALDLMRRVGCGSRSHSETLLVAFSRQATATGLAHALADDVLVVHDRGEMGRRALERDIDEVPDAGEQAALMMEAEDEATPVRHALLSVGVATRGLSVTLDARALGTGVGGTQRYIVELALALARTEHSICGCSPPRICHPV